MVKKAVRFSFKRFVAIVKSRNLEFLRDRSALGWNLFMPVMLVAGFAFLFSEQGSVKYKVAVLESAQTNDSETSNRRHPFYKTRHVQFIKITDLKSALGKLSHHQLDMIISPGVPFKYWVNKNSSNGYMLEQVLHGSVKQSDKKPASRLKRQEVSGEQVRYIDWVLPGILGMNMMFSCLFGIGFVIVRYRKMGVLKRFKATPLTAFEFVSAQLVSRFMIVMVITSLVFIGSSMFTGLQIKGNLLLLFLVFSMGAISMISMAMIIAARTTSEEFANGLLNLISWPMLIFSGVWFSLEGLHSAAQTFAQLLPLTHMLDAARAVIVDGAGLVAISQQMLVLTIMSIVFLIIGSLLFRWER